MTLSTPTSCLDWNKYCLDLKKHWTCRACTFIILHTVLCHLPSAPSLANGLTMQVCTRGHRAVGFGMGAGFITRCNPQERAYIWRSAEELQSAMKTFSPRHLLMSSMLRAGLPSGSLLKDTGFSRSGMFMGLFLFWLAISSSVAFLICNSEQGRICDQSVFGALVLTLQTGAAHEIHTRRRRSGDATRTPKQTLGIRVTESAAVRLTSSSVLNMHCNETSELSHPPVSRSQFLWWDSGPVRRWIASPDRDRTRWELQIVLARATVKSLSQRCDWKNREIPRHLIQPRL